MKFVKTDLDGVYIIEQNVYNDNRGSFVKTFQNSVFIEQNLDCDFKENYYTQSDVNVIRGMHFQIPPFDHSKLVTVIQGKIIDVILDLRKKSKTFKKFISVELSRDNRKSIFIPKGIAHGFGSLCDNSIAYYMVTTEYSPSHDKGIRYDSFGFKWPILNPIISNRDMNFPDLKIYDSPFEG